MKRINEFIIEKLKVSSKHALPSIDDFVNMFLEYINQSEDTSILFKDLESCKDYNGAEPETFIDILPSYKFNGNEEFLNLRGNKYFVVPKDTIYIISIDLYKDKNDQDYYFTLYFLPEDGIDKANFKLRHNFDICKEDLIDIIGEDIYLEIYDYMHNYK